jgi:flagellin-like hook-associated protein FlgL
MTRINSFLGSGSLTAQAALGKSLREENRSLERLATLQRINRGSDDPAGLIAAAALESELTAIETAEQNAARADALLSVADSAMGQVGELINTVESSALAAAGDGATDAEKAAYQQQIDAALEAIDRIGATTQFNGRKLLDGSASSLTFVFSADPSNSSSVALPQLGASTLGGAAGVLNDLRSGGSASVSANDPAASIEIARQARSQLLGARAEVGAFQKLTIDSSREVLSRTAVELTSALSSIRDTDVAAETARLVRSRLVSDSALASVRTNGVQARRLAILLSRVE